MTLLAVERIKLFSTRSPWWCMAIALALTVGFSTLVTVQSRDFLPTFDIANTQAGGQFGLMVMMVMAALAVTTEYRFGTIRTTFQAVPNRTAALLAKTVVVSLLAGVIGVVAAFASWGLAFVLRTDADLTLDTADEWRMVAGAGLVYLLAAVLAVAVGVLVRQSAGAITLLLLYSLLVESLVLLIPDFGDDIHQWMPFVNAQHFLTAGSATTNQGMPFGAWGSLAYFAAITVGLLVVALVVANRRDA